MKTAYPFPAALMPALVVNTARYRTDEMRAEERPHRRPTRATSGTNAPPPPPVHKEY